MKGFKKKDLCMSFYFIVALGFLLIQFFNLQSQSSLIPNANAQIYISYSSFMSPHSGLIHSFPGILGSYAGSMSGFPLSQPSSLGVTYAPTFSAYSSDPFFSTYSSDPSFSAYSRGVYTGYHYDPEPWVDPRRVGEISDPAIIYGMRWSDYASPEWLRSTAPYSLSGQAGIFTGALSFGPDWRGNRSIFNPVYDFQSNMMMDVFAPGVY